ncbi:predicted protein [Plenodomus lingam JN3]|uniref:Predicted protein n=1 Tax=Leptosphaeria maculans (strain JN3 / isolate v23.1.3 / race Av1-4-5-6-7-8) TaxID=985895 RepID=E4ZPU5_LEPMJ|nr:predicted protein [Plenodomus lingam JN3]CBX93480.1 predicted protein [Plenodomus lingam JN3]
MAAAWAEDVWIVSVDTNYLARGPVFRAVDLLRGEEGEERGKRGKGRAGRRDSARGDGGVGELDDETLHRGEYLVMYRIPPQAVRDQTVVARGEGQGWRAVGGMGGS